MKLLVSTQQAFGVHFFLSNTFFQAILSLALVGCVLAEPGYGYGGYGYGYGHGYHPSDHGYYGKREAEANAPGYGYGHGYGHGYGYGHHGYYGKREAEANAATEPGYGYGHGYGHGYGYGHGLF